MAYYNTTIFPTKPRLQWEKTFKSELLKCLFNPEQLLNAINQEKAISIQGSPVDDLTYEELAEAIEHIENENYQTYSLTTNTLDFELLSMAGISQDMLDEMSIMTKFSYHNVLAHALRPLVGYEDAKEPTEFKKIYQDYIDKHPEQKEYVENETKNYFYHLLQLAEPIIHAHQKFVHANQTFQTQLNANQNNPTLCQYALKLRDEVLQLSKKVHSVEEIDTLVDVEETCAKALKSPSDETIQACIDKGKELTNLSITKSLGGLMLSLAGVAILTISVAVALESFGIAAPLSVLGMGLGESLIFGGLAGGSAALGAGGSAYGSYMFFKHSQSVPISEDLFAVAKTVDCVA